MRVLHVVHAYPPSKGGSQFLAQQVAERWVKRYGDEVAVLTTVADDLTYFWRGGDALPAGVEQQDGVTVERLPVLYQGRWLRRAVASLTYRLHLPGNDYWRTLEQGPLIPGLVQRIAKSRAQVVFAHAFPLRHMYDAQVGARRAGIPLVYLGALHLHDRWGYDRPMIYRAIRQADAYIAHTPVERDAVVAHGADPDKVAVIGAGVDLAPFEQADGATMRLRLGLGDDPVVIVMAKQVARKRFDLILQAMPQVWEAVPTARLLLAGGRGDYSAKIEAEIAALPAAWRSRVTVVHDFAEADKPALLAASDLLMLASAEESFGIALVEAWAAAKPVIGANVGAVASIIDHGADGLHFAYPDAGSLAQAIRTLLTQPDAAARMGQAGLAKVRARYTWDQVAAEIRARLLQVVEQRR
ncbi:MAG: glycosyltransferase family 4 protein [Caldilineaceae bacterium]|nr:glycosyltransferase family 4 protein [Caldilineaceae bacterium]